MSRSVSQSVGIDAVPQQSLSRTHLPSIDYVDRFGARFGAQASPERWARALFNDVPTPGERLIWAAIMRLRLQPPGPRVVAGWAISDQGADWIRLRAESDHIVGNLIVEIEGPRMALTTALHYRTRFGGLQWRILAPIHRKLAPMLFTGPDQRLHQVCTHVPQ